jgi:hypothetical protein
MENQVRRFWVRDAHVTNGKTGALEPGHPRTLVAFEVVGSDIKYATATWAPGYRFNRRQAHDRATGRLKSDNWAKLIIDGAKDIAEAQEQYIELQLVIIADIVRNARPNTKKCLAAQLAMARLLRLKPLSAVASLDRMNKGARKMELTVQELAAEFIVARKQIRELEEANRGLNKQLFDVRKNNVRHLNEIQRIALEKDRYIRALDMLSGR